MGGGRQFGYFSVKKCHQHVLKSVNQKKSQTFRGKNGHKIDQKWVFIFSKCSPATPNSGGRGCKIFGWEISPLPHDLYSFGGRGKTFGGDDNADFRLGGGGVASGLDEP